MSLEAEFAEEVGRNIQSLSEDLRFQELSRHWLAQSSLHKYSYNFSWMGRPIIQYPQDMIAIQELIWLVKPDLVIETGIAHGGSLVMSASLLALLDYCDAVNDGKTLDPKLTRRRVLGIDIDIRSHNRAAILAHPMSHRIDMLEGSSVNAEVIDRVHAIARNFNRIFVILDSNHTHEHVLDELEAYAPLTTPGSYCVVFDTIIEDMSEDLYPGRAWRKGNSPKTAVWEFLRRLRDEGRTSIDGTSLEFEPDSLLEKKLSVTVGPDGYLRRV